MSLTVHLIRHGEHDLLGRVLAGRMPGVHLSSSGRNQAEALAQRFARIPLEAVLAGPLERAQETAVPIATRTGLVVETAPELDELDFGAWTGRAFDELAADPRWQRFNTWRSGTRPPNGELMGEAQARIVGLILRLQDTRADAGVVLVSHGDVIKSAVAHFLGVHLDLFQRIEIAPASTSVIALADFGPRVLQVNAAPESG